MDGYYNSLGSQYLIKPGIFCGDAGANRCLLQSYGVYNKNLLVCPGARTNWMPTNNDVYTNYRYNGCIGGTTWTSPTDPNYKAIVVPPNRYLAVPLKIGQFKNASKVMLFTEHLDVVDAWTSVPQFRPYQSSAPTDGVQSVTDTKIVHLSRTDPTRTYYTPWGRRPVQYGSNNVVFADGHGEAVRITLDKQGGTWGDGTLKIEPRW